MKFVMQGTFSFVWDIAKVIILSLIIIVPVRWFIVQPFFVRGASMEQNYHHGDYLLVDEISYRFNEPERGDVIIFKYPQDTSQFYIKRIIALPGETISLSNNEIRITNDQFPKGILLEEGYIEDYTSGSVNKVLADDEYFVFGDNRDASFDSRRFGPLEEEYIIGKVFLRAWPLDSLGMLQGATYSY